MDSPEQEIRCTVKVHTIKRAIANEGKISSLDSFYVGTTIGLSITSEHVVPNTGTICYWHTLVKARNLYHLFSTLLFSCTKSSKSLTIEVLSAKSLFGGEVSISRFCGSIKAQNLYHFPCSCGHRIAKTQQSTRAMLTRHTQ